MRHVVNGPVLRLILVGLVLLGVQNTLCANHPITDVRIQVLLAFTAAAGAASSAERGALAGFVLGMMYDLSSGQPLGQTALAYGFGGLVAGYLTVLKPVPRWWMIAGFVTLGAAAGEAAIPVVMLITGQQGWLSMRVFRVVGIVTVAALALAPIFVPIGRWAVAYRSPHWKALPE